MLVLGLAIAGSALLLTHAATKPVAAPSGNATTPAYPPVPKTDKNLATACAAANAYVAQLARMGLPKPPGWDSLDCKQRVVAVASIGGPQNAAAAIAILYGGPVADAVSNAVHNAIHKVFG